jgi:HSP20 family molecular chaperone IbpA
MQDATETETDYRLRIDLPGFSFEEVNVELQGDKLKVTAEKEESKGAVKVSLREGCQAEWSGC